MTLQPPTLERPRFTGYCTSRRAADDATGAPDVSAGRRPAHVLETRATRCALWLGPDGATGRSTDGRVTVALYGELYGADRADATAWAADGFAGAGEAFARTLRGAFSLVVADADRDALYVVTDRLNARRLFWRSWAGGVVFGASPAHLPLEGLSIDPVAVGWLLSHGIPHAGRTPYRGLQVLERACVHRFDGTRFEARPYWTWTFEPSASASERQFQERLTERLDTAMRRCLWDHPDVFLSLSAGYDAKAVAGMLRRAGVERARAFSYVNGVPVRDSDEAIAARLATVLGYPHRLVQSYDGDYLHHLHTNARLGQGFCYPCDEVQAWETLAPTFGAAARPALFAGDECMGWDDVRLETPADVLASVGIFGPERLGGLEALLPGETFREMRGGVRSDVHDLWQRTPAYDDLHDRKDFLYLDQRLHNLILPWRAYFVGRAVPVRNPLLDADVLDLMRTVPSRLRRNKRLFRHTAQRLFPDLFRIPRARRENYYVDAAAAARTHRRALEDHVRTTASPLDELLPPDALLKLLGRVAEAPGGTASPARKAFDELKRRAPLRLKDAMKRRVRPSTLAQPPPPAAVLRWWLVLREALHLQQPPNDAR